MDKSQACLSLNFCLPYYYALYIASEPFCRRTCHTTHLPCSVVIQKIQARDLGLLRRCWTLSPLFLGSWYWLVQLSWTCRISYPWLGCLHDKPVLRTTYFLEVNLQRVWYLTVNLGEHHRCCAFARRGIKRSLVRCPAWPWYSWFLSVRPLGFLRRV